jgi:hypothetical protein
LSASFEVVIKGSGSNVDEWRRALQASSADLRVDNLSDDEKRVARGFGIRLEDYARGLLALRLGRERRESEARALGQHVAEILRGLGEEYRLSTIIWEVDRLRWMLRIQAPKRVLGVPVPFELAEDVIDSGVLSQVERLRVLLMEGLGRGDLIPRRSE